MAKTTKKAKRTTKKSTKQAAAAGKAAGKNLTALTKTYSHIDSVSEVSESGKITRVVINCQADYGLDDCNGTREIATQDAFQVTRCAPCQREFSKRRRRKNPDA